MNTDIPDDIISKFNTSNETMEFEIPEVDVYRFEEYAIIILWAPNIETGEAKLNTITGK